MMNEKLVTVVMATYQGDDMGYLQQAVNSILEQTYKQIQFIIVIDGRVDGERVKYFNDLARNYGVDIIVNNENRGPAFARNCGIAAADGGYIAVMDADDVSAEDRIEYQLRFLVDHDLDVVSSDLLVIDGFGNITGKRKVPAKHGAIRRLAPYRCPLHNPSVFGKAAVFKSFGYDPSMRVSEDYHLWVRLLVNDYRLGNSTYCCVKYRQISADVEKRTGLKYAYADIKVKCLAMGMVGVMERPLVFVVGIAAAFIRLLPNRLFAGFYRLRQLLP